MKNIKELSSDEAAQILDFVYPNSGDLYWFQKLSFEPIVSEDNKQQITLGGRSIIGIKYHNGQDNCILHFDNTKVVLWLYKNGYDITDLLESNSYLTEMENDFDDFAFNIQWMAKGEDSFRDDVKKNWTLDYVKKRCKELVDKYYYKDYK